MRKISLLMGTAMAVAMAGSAFAAPKGWYVGIAGGANWVEDSVVTEQFAGFGPVLTGNLDIDTGWVAALNIGYRWHHWRLELEGAYRDNDGARLFGVGGTSPVELTEWSLMVNAIYDIHLSQKWTLSLGAGIGGDYIDYEEPSVAPQWDDDTVLAGQLLAQLSYAVSSRAEVYLDYHYLVLDDPEITRATAPVETVTFDVNKHSVMLGLRYDLHADEEPVAPPPPPPPPPPVKQFIVFFGFNKFNLTAEASSVVREAASAAKSQGAASILVTGHTDTVGSNTYNQKLSMRRADAVKAGLIAEGIPAGGITTIGKGETELLVQTGDGVKEPQNRRATIDLQ